LIAQFQVQSYEPIYPFMITQTQTGSVSQKFASLHGLGVVCGIGAGVWLGAAEAPTKLVTTGLSPFAISLCMVAGVFTARWTVPTLLKGTRYIISDLARKKHLIVWALLAGALWAVANTLTVFAIRDVGLAIAFPLWNANSLIGLFWGWLLFGELRGASGTTVAKVVIGAVAIVAAAILLGFSTIQGGIAPPRNAIHGIVAAAGASLLWGTMYVPYRKAYISGMNPLSFVTAFTVGELSMMFALVLALDGGTNSPVFHSSQVKPMLFWLFLGGFVWVIGDIFQQFAVKYLGIGRGIPLSNTNQLWGLAWGALVFGELACPIHPKASRGRWLGRHDSRSTVHKLRGGRRRRAILDGQGTDRGVQALRHGLPSGAGRISWIGFWQQSGEAWMVGLSHRRVCSGDLRLARSECRNSIDCRQLSLAGYPLHHHAHHTGSVLLGAMEDDEILVKPRMSFSGTVQRGSINSCISRPMQQ
jgi:drug/metabolite transporter (DMT)-like permease